MPTIADYIRMAKRSRNIRPVDTPAGTLYVQGLRADETDACRIALDTDPQLSFRALVVARSLVNRVGGTDESPVFEPVCASMAEAKELAQDLNTSLYELDLANLYTEAAVAGQTTAAKLDGLTKNSERAGSDTSGDSPSPSGAHGPTSSDSPSPSASTSTGSSTGNSNPSA